MSRFKVIVLGEGTERHPYASFAGAKRKFETLTGKKVRNLQQKIAEHRHHTIIRDDGAIVTIIDCDAEPTPAALEAIGQQRLF